MRGGEGGGGTTRSGQSLDHGDPGITAAARHDTRTWRAAKKTVRCDERKNSSKSRKLYRTTGTWAFKRGLKPKSLLVLNDAVLGRRRLVGKEDKSSRDSTLSRKKSGEEIASFLADFKTRCIALRVPLDVNIMCAHPHACTTPPVETRTFPLYELEDAFSHPFRCLSGCSETARGHLSLRAAPKKMHRRSRITSSTPFLPTTR